jgi:hypothetical protein
VTGGMTGYSIARRGGRTSRWRAVSLDRAERRALDSRCAGGHVGDR